MAEQLALNFEFRANQTFDDFFPGDNQEIIKHLKNCLNADGEQQIFLYGGAGLGKTHLLQATCRLAHQANLGVFYFALSAGALPDPALLVGLDKFDLVCFDNIEFIAGDPIWEQAFFNFFNRHRGAGHSLILSAAMAPGRVAVALPDLKTRLCWGLSLKLKPLAEDDKIEALTFKAKHLGFEISPSAAKFLLIHYDRDMPNLWALLDRLDRATLSAQRKLTLPFLKQFIQRDEQGR